MKGLILKDFVNLKKNAKIMAVLAVRKPPRRLPVSMKTYPNCNLITYELAELPLWLTKV
jgi:hypothetical protein